MRLMGYGKLRIVGGTGLLTLLSTLGPALPAGAQVPAAPPAPSGLPERIIYTKSSSFDLPILMKDRATQQRLREVCLYVKAPGTNWVKQDSAPPAAHKFSYRAPRDGEYWFNLVTIDNQGRATPPDVTSAPPGLRVVVDTRPPVIEMDLAGDSDGTLRCKVQDEHIDAKLEKVLTAVAHGPAGDTPLEMVAGQPGVFRVRADLRNCTIRVTAIDLAKNSTSRKSMSRKRSPNRPRPPRRCRPRSATSARPGR